MDQRLEDIDFELLQVNAELKRIRERKRQLDMQDNAQPKAIGKHMQLVVLFLYIFSNHQLEAPIWWLQGFGRAPRFRKFEKRPGEFEECVSDLYLENRIWA
jgi:hypothetical protein